EQATHMDAGLDRTAVQAQVEFACLRSPGVEFLRERLLQFPAGPPPLRTDRLPGRRSCWTRREWVFQRRIQHDGRGARSLGTCLHEGTAIRTLEFYGLGPCALRFLQSACHRIRRR